MLVARSSEVNEIVKNFGISGKENSFARVVLINGYFGTGKTSVIDEAEKILAETRQYDCLLKCSSYKDIAFIPDFTYHLASAALIIARQDAKPEPRESEYVHLKYIDNLIKIKESDFESFNTLLKKIILKSAADSNLEAYKLKKSDEVDILPIYDAFFEKNGDKDIMKNIGLYAAEALIVDIMNYFFPLSTDKPSFEHYLSSGSVPKKILIILDDADAIADSIIEWIADIFLPYCSGRSFHEFISFDFEGSKLYSKVTDFLDFRFIIATRHNYSTGSIIQKAGENGIDVLNIRLLPFNEENISGFIAGYGLQGEITAEDALRVTCGIPFVMAMWLESRSYAANNFDNFILPLVVDRIFKYSAAYEIEWVKNAAFLDYIDSDSLRCFAAFEGSTGKALHYFRNMNSLAELQGDNALSVIPLIKKFIAKFVELESKELFGELADAAVIASVQRELMLPFDKKERQLVSKLGYFVNFDKEFVPDFVFGDNSGEIKRIITDYPYFFVETESKTAFKPEVFNQLGKFNKLTDKDNYESTIEEVKLCWENYLNHISQENEILEKEIAGLEIDVENEDEAIKHAKHEHTEQQLKFMREENELIGLKVALADYSINKNLYSAVSYFSIAIILCVCGYFIIDLFSDSPNISSFEMIQSILYGVAAIFGIIGGVYTIRSLASSSKTEYEKLKTQYNDKLAIKEERQNSILELRNTIENRELNIKQLKDKQKSLSERLQMNAEKIRTPFYADSSEVSI